MEFGAEKCTILIMKKENKKNDRNRNAELEKHQNTLGEKENYKFLGISKGDISSCKKR